VRGRREKDKNFWHVTEWENGTNASSHGAQPCLGGKK